MYNQVFNNACTYTVPIKDYSHDLVWCEHGHGFLKSEGYDYGEEYWEKYQGYVNDLGHRLTAARIDFIKRNLGTLDGLCDVGIGSGEFVDKAKCKGFDVNPFAKEWLTRHENYGDPYAENFKALSFWDVLEHIEDPSPLLRKAEHVFIS